MGDIGKLEEEAVARKERLKKWKDRRGFNDTELEPPDKKKALDGDGQLPKPVFRSYRPQDESLKESSLPRVQPTDVTDKVQDQLDSAKPEPLLDEVDLVNLAPRKPDWDLKRDVAKKLEKLEKRTQRAIAELIRDRLQEGNEDLVNAVNAQTTTADEDE